MVRIQIFLNLQVQGQSQSLGKVVHTFLHQIEGVEVVYDVAKGKHFHHARVNSIKINLKGNILFQINYFSIIVHVIIILNNNNLL